MSASPGIVAHVSTGSGATARGHVDASGGRERSAQGGHKVCAFAQIRWQKAIKDVKSFYRRLGAVWVAVGATAGMQATTAAGTRTLRAKNTKVLLLSVFRFMRGRHCDIGARARGVMAGGWRRVRRGRERGCGRAPCENFSPGLLTVKKSVIRFRHSRPCCEQSEQNRHPVAKHNLDIHLASEDGGDGFASPGEPQGPFSSGTCLATCGRYPRIRHDALDATAVPAMSHCGFALPGRFHSIDH